MVKPVSSVVRVMPSWALERWVEVTLRAPMDLRQAALAARLPGFEIRTVEVDQRELGRDEEPGSDREEESDAQQ